MLAEGIDWATLAAQGVIAIVFVLLGTVGVLSAHDPEVAPPRRPA